MDMHKKKARKVVNICEESKLSLTIASIGRSKIGDINQTQSWTAAMRNLNVVEWWTVL